MADTAVSKTGTYLNPEKSAVQSDITVNTMKRLFTIAIGLSGSAALAYQVVWQRVLTQIIGSDAVSMVLVVTIFMICLGIGSELARFLVVRSQTRALRLYALIEILVGIYGIVSIPILRGANTAIAGTGNSLSFDFILNLCLLAPPIIGMGLTTPLIVHVAKQSLDNVGRTVGSLYGWNIAGAAIGALVTGLVLIEATGLIGTSRIAALLNIVAAGLALYALRSIGMQSSIKKESSIQKPVESKIAFGTIIAAVLFGFGTLAIQVIFFRILSNYLTLSTIVFPVLLCAYLCLMSLGQWVGGQLADRFNDRLPTVIATLFATGSVLFLAALRFPPAWAAPFNALRFSSFNGQLITDTHPNLIGDPSPFTVFWFSLILMVSVVAWSGLFPVMFRFITRRIEEAGSRFARMYTLYTIGNVAGAFVCGFLLLPLLGTGGSAAATIFIVALGCLFFLIWGGKVRKSVAAWGALAIGVGAACLMPQDYYKTFQLGNYKVEEVFEGRTGVATVIPTSRFYTIIDVNRTASASALKTDPAPGDMYQAWRWNHTDLMALDPSFRPKNVLVIGIGHAYLIEAMLDHPFVEKITVVDLSAEVVEAVKKYTKTSAKRIFTDPRVEIVIADGRRYVQSAIKRGEKYDLVQNKINEPWHAGGGNLFTEEFFQEEKQLLTPNGYLSTRPLTGHLTDGLKIFGNAIWAGYYHMYFKNGTVQKPSTALITPDIKQAWNMELPARPEINTEKRNQLAVTYFSEIPKKMATDSNTDDRPTFEYYWLRQLFGTWVSPRVNFWDLDLKNYTTSLPVKVTNSH